MIPLAHEPKRAESATFSERLRRGDELAGLLVKMPDPATTEMAGHLGFDFVVLDTEHGPDDAGALDNHLRAADAAGIPALVRVPLTRPDAILRALDGGAAGLVLPRVMTTADVDRAVQAAHYPPLGTRGLALTTRAGRYGTVDAREHVARALRETILVVQIEDVDAVAASGAIATHPQVTGVFIGPTDLSASAGKPGELDDPEVRALIAGVVEAATGADDTAVCILATDAPTSRRWRERGVPVSIFPASTLMARGLREIVAEVSDGRRTGGA